jgi:ribosomal protein S18 acetylase RimI-like enzyme
MWQKVWRLGADFGFYYKHEGLLSAAGWLAEVSRTAPYNRINWLVMARPLDLPIAPFEPRIPVEWRLAPPADLSLIADLVPPSEFAYLQRRLLQGRICIMAIHENKAVGCGWMTDKVTFDIDNLEIPLRKGDAYMDDLYVDAAYRSHGIGGALNAKRLEYLRSQNFNRALGIVRSDNEPALTLNRRNGWVEVDRMTFRRILLWRKFQYRAGSF